MPDRSADFSCQNSKGANAEVHGNNIADMLLHEFEADGGSSTYG